MKEIRLGECPNGTGRYYYNCYYYYYIIIYYGQLG